MVKSYGESSACINCEGAGWNIVSDPRDPSGKTPMQEECDCRIVENLKAKAGWNHILNSNLTIIVKKLEVEVEKLAKF